MTCVFDVKHLMARYSSERLWRGDAPLIARRLNFPKLCDFLSISKLNGRFLQIPKNNYTILKEIKIVIAYIQNATEINVSQVPVDDLCASQIVMNDGREFLMVIVYISPNQKINDIIAFLHRHEGSMLLKDNLDKLPLLLAGDFNKYISHSLQLITFLQEKFSLHINNDPREATTRYGTAIYMEYSQGTLITYNRPIVTLIPEIVPLEASTATVTEITDEATDNID
ncbi:Uncharacterized protein FWK35_00013680 [Aphis craccivora]|uniref:Uncharacterized protein n=1 Tax=Aphis craccivora TaxID=307492 RepID=A0A6G0YGB1_APHCR|nr:Uncharacterized protein FWK35_00013680 [Aphis craccivora]